MIDIPHNIQNLYEIVACVFDTSLSETFPRKHFILSGTLSDERFAIFMLTFPGLLIKNINEIEFLMYLTRKLV